MKKFLLLAIAVLVVVLGSAYFGNAVLRGSILGDVAVDAALKVRADTNGDGVLSPREIRKSLFDIIRGVLLHRPEYDIDGDGTVNRADLTIAKQSLRRLMTASCGNGTVEAGEQCDDQNIGSGDGCSAACRVEDGYECTGAPSVCATGGNNGGNPPVSTCGNGAVDAWEQCDDGNAADGDGCSRTCFQESQCTLSLPPKVWRFNETLPSFVQSLYDRWSQNAIPPSWETNFNLGGTYYNVHINLGNPNGYSFNAPLTTVVTSSGEVKEKNALLFPTAAGDAYDFDPPFRFPKSNRILESLIPNLHNEFCDPALATSIQYVGLRFPLPHATSYHLQVETGQCTNIVLLSDWQVVLEALPGTSIGKIVTFHPSTVHGVPGDRIIVGRSDDAFRAACTSSNGDGCLATWSRYFASLAQTNVLPSQLPGFTRALELLGMSTENGLRRADGFYLSGTERVRPMPDFQHYGAHIPLRTQSGISRPPYWTHSVFDTWRISGEVSLSDGKQRIVFFGAHPGGYESCTPSRDSCTSIFFPTKPGYIAKFGLENGELVKQVQRLPDTLQQFQNPIWDRQRNTVYAIAAYDRPNQSCELVELDTQSLTIKRSVPLPWPCVYNRSMLNDDVMFSKGVFTQMAYIEGADSLLVIQQNDQQNKTYALYDRATLQLNCMPRP